MRREERGLGMWLERGYSEHVKDSMHVCAAFCSVNMVKNSKDENQHCFLTHANLNGMSTSTRAM